MLMHDKMDKIMKPTFLGCLLLGLLLGLTGCPETKETKWQYMPDMADGPTVKPQEDFLNPPDHSVAVNAIIYPDDVTVAENEFRNPFPSDKENLIPGKKLYGIYCTLCHGPNGKGKGTLTDAYPKSAVPDLTRTDLAARKDGFFFMKISKGGPMMPSYGHATSRQERWQITLYLRSLQGK